MTLQNSRNTLLRIRPWMAPCYLAPQVSAHSLMRLEVKWLSIAFEYQCHLSRLLNCDVLRVMTTHATQKYCHESKSDVIVLCLLPAAYAVCLMDAARHFFTEQLYGF